MIYAIVVASFALIALGGFLYSRYAVRAEKLTQKEIDAAYAEYQHISAVEQKLRNDL